MHTDSADIVALLSLKLSKEGGLSSWSSSVSVHNELLKLGRKVPHCLCLAQDTCLHNVPTDDVLVFLGFGQDRCSLLDSVSQEIRIKVQPVAASSFSMVTHS